eukprot:jgi/Bigna1/67239/fgenesh1_pg.3_\
MTTLLPFAKWRRKPSSAAALFLTLTVTHCTSISGARSRLRLMNRLHEGHRRTMRAHGSRGGVDNMLLQRRPFLSSIAMGIAIAAGTSLTVRPKNADAAMVMYPPDELNNRYILMRAGEDQLLARDEIMTNKVYTNAFDHALTNTGKKQVVSAYKSIVAMTTSEDDIVLWPSIQFNAYQSATILAELIGLGQNRIVPEYTFLDPRGMGGFEGNTFKKYDLVHQRDEENGILWKPPRNDDGTDNESVNDVFIRVRQAMSITETQYSGKTVVFISPDSDNLSILEAAIRAKQSGDPFLNSLRNHNRFFFNPGEVREVILGPEQLDNNGSDDLEQEQRFKRSVSQDDVRSTLGLQDK